MFTGRAGQRTAKLARELHAVPELARAHAELDGVDVHAEVAIDGRDRKRLERLCRYVARPPLALDRLEEHGDGRLRLRFKRAWKDGTHAVLFEALDLIARLAALVPPPRFPLLRYHGVLSGNATERAEVVPGRPPRKEEQLPLFREGEPRHLEPPPPPTRHPWAWLLKRVFAAEVSLCPRCPGKMRIVELATEPADAARVLADLGLAARAPPERCRAPPPRRGQLALSFTD
jgi:hypothetical protein